MTSVVPAEGVLLDRILATMDDRLLCGLSRDTFARFDRARGKTAWATAHQQRLALVDDGKVLASALRCERTALLDERQVSVCGISELFADPDHRGDGQAGQLLEHLVAEAGAAGAGLVLLTGDDDPAVTASTPAGFELIPTLDREIRIAEPPDHGAPMTPLRGGEDRDLQAIVAMGQTRARTFGFHLDRNADSVKHAITQKRMLAGFAAPGARQVHFVIAEEGITAAAYVVITVRGGTWTLEECGDRDPSGARVGAILQALIALEPVERRPIVRGWLPAGFAPPQISITSSVPSAQRLFVRALAASKGAASVLTAGTAPGLTLTTESVLLWQGDVCS